MRSYSYKHIFKSVTTLGGSQGVMILCSLVRAKLIAVILGPTATGFFAVFNNAVETVGSLTRLDLRRASVSEISKAKSAGRTARIVPAVLKTSWMLGLAGGVLMVAISPLLSFISFDNRSMTVGFATLGIAVMALSVQEGYYSVITGMGHVGRFALSQTGGSIIGLLVSIPLFFWLGDNSIVPSIIVYAVASAVISHLMTRGIATERETVTIKESLKTLTPILKLGGLLTMAAFVTKATDYIFISWLTRDWSIETAGVYTSGATLVSRSATLLLAALTAEYYPRISAIAPGNTVEISGHVRSQVNVLLVIAIPLMALLVVFDRFIVELLYSKEYLGVIPYIAGAAGGVPLKIASWSLAFIILARGEGKVYLVVETLSAIISLVLNMVSFKTGGMEMLGYVSMLNEGIYLVMVAGVCRRYGVTLSRGIVSLMIIGAVTVAVMGLIWH